MNDGADQHIERLESFTSVPVPVSRHEAPPFAPSAPKPPIPAGLIFGALSGSLLGAVTATACAFFIDLSDWLGQAALIGAAAGPVGGGIIGVWERKKRGNLVRLDIATMVGAIYGLFPALLVVLGFFDVVRGAFSLYAVVGTTFIGPMTGLLIGAILDRGYEASRRRSCVAAIGFSLTGVAACVGLVWLIARIDTAPDPKEIGAEARTLILQKWRENPDLSDARIRKITLTHIGGKVYEGTFSAKIGADVQRFKLKVTLVNEAIAAEWQPVDE
jgi:hypothetical protein